MSKTSAPRAGIYPMCVQCSKYCVSIEAHILSGMKLPTQSLDVINYVHTLLWAQEPSYTNTNTVRRATSWIFPVDIEREVWLTVV